MPRQGPSCPITLAEPTSTATRSGENPRKTAQTTQAPGAKAPKSLSSWIFSANRNATLIFSSGVKHGRHIVDVLQREHGIECGFVCGATPIPERDETLARLKAGRLKYLCNVNVLTTGFDAPRIDCVALVRPTMSPGLYYQMVGRGFRKHPDEKDCLVLDFGGNVLRHGPVDQLKKTSQKKRAKKNEPKRAKTETLAREAAQVEWFRWGA